MKVIPGQFVPTDLPKRHDVMFLGEKPSLYFVRHPKERSKGNYNATASDFIFHNWIRKYFKKAVYVTDMVKTEGRAGTRLREWDKDPRFRELLQEELNTIHPKIIIVMSKKVEKLFTNDPLFLKYKDRVRTIYHPSHVARWNKFSEWDAQFEDILKELKD